MRTASRQLASKMTRLGWHVLRSRRRPPPAALDSDSPLGQPGQGLARQPSSSGRGQGAPLALSPPPTRASRLRRELAERITASSPPPRRAATAAPEQRKCLAVRCALRMRRAPQRRRGRLITAAGRKDGTAVRRSRTRLLRSVVPVLAHGTAPRES